MQKNWINSVVLASFAFSSGLSSVAVWADGLPGAPGGAAGGAIAGGPQPSPFMSFVPMILMFAVVYFLMIRPQQKKMKEQQDMVSALKEGDEVVTQAGILGKITSVTEKVITLEVARDVRIKVVKSQVSQVLKGGVL